MDWILPSSQEHGIAYPARKHGRREKVREIIALTQRRTRREIERTLGQPFQHHPAGERNEHAE